MGMLGAAREVKHLGFVANKRLRRGLRRAKFDLATAAFRDVERIRPYIYRPELYVDTFLAKDFSPGGLSEFPRQIFAMWTGDNPLTPSRARNLADIEQRIGLPLTLVTQHTLDQWLVPGYPLHPAYENLSLIHRSDYLRGYLMHHHGGAYVDIKRPLNSWAQSFDQMAVDQRAWVTSYATSHANWVGKLHGRLGRDIVIWHRLMFGKSGFLMRSHTPLTAEWMAQMDAILDELLEPLAAHPGGVYGDSGQYPVSWTDLLGRVLDPLTLKHLDHVRRDHRMLLDFTDYR